MKTLKTFNLKEIKSIEIIGLRWFDKINGNTYHSTQVIINDEDSFYEGMTYGYDRAYEQTAQEILIKKVLNKRASNKLKDNRNMFQFFKNRNITIISHHKDVKKKDL